MDAISRNPETGIPTRAASRAANAGSLCAINAGTAYSFIIRLVGDLKGQELIEETLEKKLTDEKRSYRGKEGSVVRVYGD